MKRILFTHDDLDGAGCAIVFQFQNIHILKLESDDTRIVHCSNSNIDEKIQSILDENEKQKIIDEKCEIIFADIAPSETMCTKLAITFNLDQFAFYDHHLTNDHVVRILRNHPNKMYLYTKPINDKMESGTSIMYKKEIRSNVHDSILETKLTYMDQLVDSIRSWDTFEWKKTNNMQAKQIQILFSLLGMERFIEYHLNRLHGDIICPTALGFVNASIEREARNINSVKFDNLFHGDLDGHPTVFMFSRGGANFSDLATTFLEKHPEIDLFVNIDFGYGTVGYRTTKDDLNTAKKFAQPNFGGGHPKASGNPISLDFMQEILSKLMKEISPGEWGMDLSYPKIK